MLYDDLVGIYCELVEVGEFVFDFCVLVGNLVVEYVLLESGVCVGCFVGVF